MKRKLICVLAVFLAAGLLAGCGKEELSEENLSGITYNRSHGSMWGVQFYIDITEDEISYTHFFLPEEYEMIEGEAEEITKEEWEKIKNSVMEFLPDLEEKKSGGFLEGMVLDGGEEKSLTLTWETEKGEKEIEYIWPGGEAFDEFEKFLEDFAKEKVLGE